MENSLSLPYMEILKANKPVKRDDVVYMRHVATAHGNAMASIMRCSAFKIQTILLYNLHCSTNVFFCIKYTHLKC